MFTIIFKIIRNNRHIMCLIEEKVNYNTDKMYNYVHNIFDL